MKVLSRVLSIDSVRRVPTGSSGSVEYNILGYEAGGGGMRL